MRIVLCVVVCVGLAKLCGTQSLRQEAYATVPQLLTSNGYPNEKHRVVTEDGYTLQLHRIPAGKRVARRIDTTGKGKNAVLVVHGLMGSSGDFVIMGPKRSLAYMLADAGYDVWLGNLRGTIYSSHLNYTKADPKFWEFSFHEHGKYDAPAMIDRVLNVTGQSKLMYIGYSMGTTTFFTMMSERPEYNSKVLAFVALAPAVFLDNVKPLATTMLKDLNFTTTMRANRMMAATFFTRELLDFIVESVCNMQIPTLDVCMRFVYMIVGDDYEQSDWGMNSVILARAQPISWRQVEHYGKIAMTGVFTSWEDGLYGAVKPYNLNNVKVPVTILYGKNDQLTEKSQIMRLAKVLRRNGVLEEAVPAADWAKFNHLDFVFARDIATLFNKPLVKRIDHLFSKYGNA